MRIALLGYGKMGKEVERAAIDRGHQIVGTYDIGDLLSPISLEACGASVLIDFTQASAVLGNVGVAAEAHLPIVIGTTGWDEHWDAINTLVTEGKIGCVFASNFSVGVNIFLEIVRTAARLLDAADYDAYVLEAHHRMKKDFPSGTALTIAKTILAEMHSKTHVQSELIQGHPIEKDALLVSSIRTGTVTGTHTVGFETEDDSIELVHRAKSRRGFALGAVRAAEWIANVKGFYRFEESIAEILGMNS